MPIWTLPRESYIWKWRRKMGKYIVTNGQNIYDVALHLYGSIEGIVDLMMNNVNLSLADVLTSGDELVFTDDYIINSEIVAYFRMNNIIPANGERNVYFKSPGYKRLIDFTIQREKTSIDLGLSGEGILQIDWGDNTELQLTELKGKPTFLHHHFNSLISENRKIRIFGDVRLQELNLSLLETLSIHLFQPLYAEQLILRNCCRDIGFIVMLNGTYKADLTGISCQNLLPLLELKSLKELDLTNAEIHQDSLDNYLISLVKKYYGRRNCTITLTKKPSGEYQEPQRDSQQRYILSSGMEAIWVLTNEPAWNEGGFWRFNINDKIYTTEP